MQLDDAVPNEQAGHQQSREEQQKGFAAHLAAPFRIRAIWMSLIGTLEGMDDLTTAPHGRSARLGPSFESVAYLARNYKFESIPLQQTVCLSPDFASVPGKTQVFRHCGGRAGRQRRQRRAKPGNIAPRRGSVSVGRYSSTAVLPEAVCKICGTGRK